MEKSALKRLLSIMLIAPMFSSCGGGPYVQISPRFGRNIDNIIVASLDRKAIEKNLGEHFRKEFDLGSRVREVKRKLKHKGFSCSYRKLKVTNCNSEFTLERGVVSAVFPGIVLSKEKVKISHFVLKISAQENDDRLTSIEITLIEK